tara:strand:+ start:85 stop:264 length:180 start_codon:yes stop_codon:yes gene_type:complete
VEFVKPFNNLLFSCIKYCFKKTASTMVLAVFRIILSHHPVVVVAVAVAYNHHLHNNLPD